MAISLINNNANSYYFQSWGNLKENMKNPMDANVIPSLMT